MAVNFRKLKGGGVSYYASYFGPDGKRIAEFVVKLDRNAKDREHVKAKARACVKAEDQRLRVKNRTWTDPRAKKRRERERRTETVVDVVDLYVGTRRSKSEHYKYRALALVRGLGERRKLVDVTTTDAERYALDRSKKVKASTLRKDLIFARSVFRWAFERNETAKRNPFEKIALPKEPPPRDHYLTHEQERKLVDAIRMPWLRRVVAWMVDTGMDRGETCALKWKQVDDPTGVVSAPRLKTGTVRHIYLTASLRAVLKEARETRNTTGLVFLDDDGQAIEPNRISLAIRRAYKRAGVPIPKGGPVKVLRHTFGTRAQEQTGNVRLTAELMGHADVRTTMRYAHVSEKAARDAMEGMDKRRRAAGGESGSRPGGRSKQQSGLAWVALETGQIDAPLQPAVEYTLGVQEEPHG